MIGAVDIGGTKVAVGMINEAGQVIARTESSTLPKRGYENTLDRITAMLKYSAEQAGVSIDGIGVGCTGPVDPVRGTIGYVEFLPGWQGAAVVDDLSRRFSCDVALENDADAAVLAESRWGAGKGVSRLMYVTISTGIGGGLVMDGRLYRGADGAHPEVGHHIVDPSGPLCACGARGCWESLASGPALADWYNAHRPDVSLLVEPRDAEEICALASQGDPHALLAIDREGYYLGLGLANLVTLFVPDVIALGGGLMQSRRLFWDRMQDTVNAACGYVPRKAVRIVPAAMGKDVALIGAASVWYYHFDEPLPGSGCSHPDLPEHTDWLLL